MRSGKFQGSKRKHREAVRLATRHRQASAAPFDALRQALERRLEPTGYVPLNLPTPAPRRRTVPHRR